MEVFPFVAWHCWPNGIWQVQSLPSTVSHGQQIRRSCTSRRYQLGFCTTEHSEVSISVLGCFFTVTASDCNARLNIVFLVFASTRRSPLSRMKLNPVRCNRVVPDTNEPCMCTGQPFMFVRKTMSYRVDQQLYLIHLVCKGSEYEKMINRNK